MVPNLKACRKRKKLTQEQLAAIVGATKRQIGAWERGENDMPMDYAVAIADALGCSLDELATAKKTHTVHLSNDEMELLGAYRLMEPSERMTMLSMCRSLMAAKNRAYSLEAVMP